MTLSNFYLYPPNLSGCSGKNYLIPPLVVKHLSLLMSASSDRLGLFSELICGGHRIYGNKER